MQNFISLLYKEILFFGALFLLCPIKIVAEPFTTCCEDFCPEVSVEGNYWMVFRNSLYTHTFLRGKEMDQDPKNSYTIRNMDKMTFRYKSGFMGSIAYTPNWFHTVELVFRGLIDWSQIRVAQSPDKTLFVPTYPIETYDWENTNQINIEYTAHFNQVELIYWNHETPRYVDYFSFSWLLGVPAILFTDRMVYDNFNQYSFGLNEDRYKIRTTNRLIGLEGGVDFENNPLCCLTWALQGKAAVYANLVEKSIALNDQNGTSALVDTQIHRIQPSYSVEFNTYLLYRVRFMHLKLGYSFFNLYKTITAPNQIRRSESLYGAHMAGKPLTLNSLYIGLGFAW